VIARPSVVAFARAMESKLVENDYKGGWDDCTWAYLLGKLCEEVREVVELFRGPKNTYGASARDELMLAAHHLGIAEEILGRITLDVTLTRPRETAAECADVGNVAMMLHDLARGLIKKTKAEASRPAIGNTASTSERKP
jgi:hypothetical protein